MISASLLVQGKLKHAMYIRSKGNACGNGVLFIAGTVEKDNGEAVGWLVRRRSRLKRTGIFITQRRMIESEYVPHPKEDLYVLCQVSQSKG